MLFAFGLELRAFLFQKFLLSPLLCFSV
jgi:hypothetical protein